MDSKVSVVINTLNAEKDITRVIRSVKWAQEIIVCDMYSIDRTGEIARKMGAKVYLHKRLAYVEPARNFAISKASNKWILILDPDEEIPESLKIRFIEIANKTKQINYVKVPRRNLIFGKWMRASMWWPDYNIRFFKKGKVIWGDKIHRPPETMGQGIELPAEEQFAIIHYHYETISQFLERMNRYTKVQAEELAKEGYKFDWRDLIKKPLSEFLGRFFANKGYEDGLHGLALSLLQAFSQLVLYLHLWEIENFKEREIRMIDLKEITIESGKEIDYWFKLSSLSKNPFKQFFQKVKNRV